MSVKPESRRQRPELSKDEARKKAWVKPVFKNLRLGFEITMYFWNR